MDHKTYPIEEALKAQSALRSAAGLEPEQFPVSSFVGMISDEIETLRTQGKSDEEIAELVRRSSRIEINGDDITTNYAPSEARHQFGG